MKKDTYSIKELAVKLKGIQEGKELDSSLHFFGVLTSICEAIIDIEEYLEYKRRKGE